MGAVVALSFLPARQSLIRQVPVSTALGDENAASIAAMLFSFFGYSRYVFRR